MDPPDNPAESTIRSEPSIKKFIKYLYRRIDSIHTDLQANKNEAKAIKAEAGSVDARTSEACNDMMTSTLDLLERLTQDFRNLQHEEKSEDVFLKQQLGALNHENTKLEQSVALLTARVGGSESDVGTELRLPEVQDA